LEGENLGDGDGDGDEVTGTVLTVEARGFWTRAYVHVSKKKPIIKMRRRGSKEWKNTETVLIWLIRRTKM